MISISYPLRCGQERTGTWAFKRIRLANHIVQILDSTHLVRYNFVVRLITEIRSWPQHSG